ncbi:MAG: phosphomannomutase/phosphoglucomutase [Planctomycetes bacterium]|nr:phosphomannomutase/phosphoglucomutase [Planctomycetota bacterium]
MLAKVFKAYDVRATYPKPLNEKLAWHIGYGAAEFLLTQAAAQGFTDPMMHHIVMGRDMRKSSPSLADAVAQGMQDYGANVIDIGLVDTPVVYFAINHFGCAGGIQVTASHNPANYNGFKISRIHAKPVGQETGLNDIQRFAAMVEREKCVAKGGRREARDVWSAYKSHLLRLMNPKTIDGSKKLKVVIDASNGMAGTMVPKVFGGVAGLKIDPIHFDNSSGEFVHEPNPLVEANLAEVRARVRETKADFGVCFDGDADRCMIVDELGEPVGCDLLLAVMLGRFLKEKPGAGVVYDLRSSRSVAEAIREAGGTPVESRVGHVFMKAKLAEVKAPIGGELSGHFYFEDMFATDSGARAFIAVVNALVDGGGKSLSELVKPFRRYRQSGEINFENEDKLGAIAALKKAYPRSKTYELDGLSLDAGEWWCNVRMSNTEPLLRLNLEARDQATVDKVVGELSPLLGHRVEH